MQKVNYQPFVWGFFACVLVATIPSEVLATGGQVFSSSAGKVESLLQQAKVWVRIIAVLGILLAGGQVLRQGGIQEAGKGVIGLLAACAVILAANEIVNFMFDSSAGVLF